MKFKLKQALKMKRGKYYYLIIGAVFLLAAITALTIYLQTNHTVEAAWYNTNWNYRQPFTITNSNGGTLTNIQKGIQINTATLVTAGKLQSNCNDLRFTDNNGNSLSYYIDSGCNTSTTNIWIIIPNLIPSTSTFYMYYGNPSAAKGSTTTGFDNVIGLQGYWTMNEGSGSSVNDSTANAHNGTIQNSPTWTTGKYSNALSFNPTSSQYVSISSAPAITSSSLTISVWAKLNGGNNTWRIMYGQGSGVSDGLSIILGYDINNHIQFSFYGNGITTTQTFTDTNWHLWTGTYNRGTGLMALYLDGSLLTSITNPYAFTGNSVTYIGETGYGGANYFNGVIDDVKVYNNVRSATQILNDYNNTPAYTIASAASVPSYSFGAEQVGPGPVAYWKFDEGTGTTANDSTASNNFGDLLPNTWQSGKVCNPAQGCLLFDGTTNYVNVPDSSSLQFGTGDFTISAWIYPKAVNYPAQGTIISKNFTGFELFIFQGNLNAYLGGVSNSISGVKTLSINTWYHVVLRRSGSTVNTYINGTLDGSATNSTSVSNIGTNLNIGERPGAGSTFLFNGIIDNVKAFNYALTPSQIQQDYSVQSVTPAPVSWWKLADGSGTSIADSTGSNIGTLNGTVSTGPTWQTADQCVSGKCILFNGTNQYIRTTNNPNIGTNATISMWVKPTNNLGSTTQGLFDTNPAATGSLRIIGTGTGGLEYNTGGSTRHSVSIGNWANQWHFITLVLSSSTTTTLYIDGQQVGTTTNSFSGSSTTFELGRYNSGNYFAGFVDDMKIYPYARTAAQIKADFNSRGTVNAGANVLGANSQNNISALNNGLVGYWKMDESSGNVLDSSGNGNTGTPASTGVVAGKFGNGRSFNGSSSTISIPDNTTIDFAASFTISAWVNTAVTDSYRYIIDKMNASSPQIGYRLFEQLSTGDPEFDVYDGTHLPSVVSSKSIADGKWHHIVAERNNTTGVLSMYVDGILTGTSIDTNTSSVINTSVALYIGNNHEGRTDREWNGTLDEVRIYNRALSPADVQNLYNFAPGPIAYYNFEEGTGNTVNDTSGSGFNGIWNGTLGSQWVNGKIGKAGNFNGSNNYVDGGTHSYGSLNVTVDAWIKTTDSTDQQYIFGGWDGTPSVQFSLNVGSSGKANMYSNASGVRINSITTVTDGKWHHVAFVDSSGTMYIFVDGKNEANGSAGTPVWNNWPFTIGCAGGTGCTSPTAMFHGVIDDLRVYTYARSQKQIIQDMTANGSSTSLARGSIAHLYHFDEGYGTVVHDSSSQGNNGAWNGTGTHWTSNGKFSKAALFNGTDDYVILSQPVQFTNQDFSISGWFQTLANTSSTTQEIWHSGYIGGNADVEIDMKDNKLYIYIRDTAGTAINGGNGITGINSLNDGKWHQFAVIRNGNTFLLYVDSVLQVSNTTALGSVDSNTQTAYIGDGFGGCCNTRFFKGSIDELKVYNYALSASDVQQDYNHNSGISMGSLGTAPDGKTASNSVSAVYCVPGDTSTCTPPIAEYNFEEASGTSVNDTSGSAATGTWNGTLGSQWKQSKPGLGWAGNFNGTDNYVLVGSSPYQGVANWTLSAWVKPANISQSGAMVFVGASNGGYGMVIANDGTGNGNKFEALFNSGWFDSGYRFANPNQWYFVTITRDSSTTRFYVNGQQTSNTYSTAPGAISWGYLTMGREQAAGGGSGFNFFAGEVDQARLYNYARTPAQIAWDYNHGGPVGWWKMDECQGTTINDSSGNGNTGTLNLGSGGVTSPGTCTDGTGTTAWNKGASGKFNSSMSFDGTDDYVEKSYTPVFTPGNQSWTVSAWIKALGGAPFQQIISWYRCGANPSCTSVDASTYQLSLNGSGKITWFIRDDTFLGGSTTSTASVVDNKWHYVVGTYDATAHAQYLYVDGNLQASNTNEILSSLSDGGLSVPLEIGRLFITGGGSIDYYNGQIDDARIYNYALTPLQIKLLNNDGFGTRFGPSIGTP